MKTYLLVLGYVLLVGCPSEETQLNDDSSTDDMRVEDINVDDEQEMTWTDDDDETNEDDEPSETREACDGAASQTCTNHLTYRSCVHGFWEEIACPAGQGCIDGACVANRCTDTCTPAVDGSGTCQFYDIDRGEWSAPNMESLHDKGRAYLSRLRRDALAFGGIGGIRYADIGTYEDPSEIRGLGDSAIFTGLYVASEALRYQETRSPVALEHLLEGLDTLHLWWNVSGVPGGLARFVQPQDQVWRNHLGQEVDLRDVTRKREQPGDTGYHRDVLYEGTRYEFLGHISRDQYQGVMLAFALAYDALGDEHETIRQRIREDVVAFMEHLSVETTLPVTLTLHFRPINLGLTEVSSYSIETELTLPYIIAMPYEYEDGRAVIDLVVDSESDMESTFYGMQEFMPNLRRIVENVDLPAWLRWIQDIPIPRSGSAVMLSSFFRVGIHMTEDVPQYAEQHERYLEHFLEHVGPGLPGVTDGEMWLDIAAISPEFTPCTEGYYGNNIMLTPLYNWLRLETDPFVRASLEEALVRLRFWPRFRDHKNSYFTYVLASGFRPEPDTHVDEAMRQLNLFPEPPRIVSGVDHRDDPSVTPKESCESEAEDALDIDQRSVHDFQWQRHPWYLYQEADLSRVSPGGDYLLAYWVGRAEGYIEEDSTGCYAIRDE